MWLFTAKIFRWSLIIGESCEVFFKGDPYPIRSKATAETTCPLRNIIFVEVYEISELPVVVGRGVAVLSNRITPCVV